MVSIKINFTGRKAKVGNLCFDPYGKPHVFVGYCDCKSKILMDLREAESFSQRWGRNKSKPANAFLLRKIEHKQA